MNNIIIDSDEDAFHTWYEVERPPLGLFTE